MRYKIVPVDPLVPFPLVKFGLKNITGLDDAKDQIRKPHHERAKKEVKDNTELTDLMEEIEIRFSIHARHKRHPKQDDETKAEIERIQKQIEGLKGRVDGIVGPIHEKHENAAKEEIAKLEERWAPIEPHLKFHLARNARRAKHFAASCKLAGCDNPRPLGTAYRSNGLVRRHTASLFCRACRRWERQISTEARRKLMANVAMRLHIVK